MHHASRRVFVDGDYVESVPAWVGQDEAKGAAFEQRFVERLTDAAEDGDALAMVWLSTIYNERWRLDAVRHTQKDDSLSRYWVQRAADVGYPTAIRWRAGSEQKSGNLGAADSLFAEAARLGDDSAYMSWALMYLDSRLDALDPERYFQIASMAVEAGAQGVHRWLKGDLDALEREVARGNQEAIAYKAIADRHLLFERMADLPENPPDPDWMLPMLCYGNPPGL